MSLAATTVWLIIFGIVVIVAAKFGALAAVITFMVLMVIGRVIAHFSGSDDR